MILNLANCDMVGHTGVFQAAVKADWTPGAAGDHALSARLEVRAGNGWEQVTSELGYERSGPERYLSCFVLLTQLIDAIKDQAAPKDLSRLGSRIAWVVTLRNMSLSVAGMLNEGIDPGLQAAIVKDLGAHFEQGLPGLAQELIALEPTLAGSGIDYQQVLGNLTQLAPSFSLRGGTIEILRGIIAKGLGIR